MRHIYTALLRRGLHSTRRLSRAPDALRWVAEWPRRRFHSAIASDADNVTFSFVNMDDQETEVTVPVGTTILEAAHKCNVELEGACDGCMACSTCHVIFDEEVYDALPEPEEAELDMLDLAPCLTNTSRLGCQIKLDASHQGIRVQLPKITRNFYVDGHVPMPH